MKSTSNNSYTRHRPNKIKLKKSNKKVNVLRLEGNSLSPENDDKNHFLNIMNFSRNQNNEKQ